MPTRIVILGAAGRDFHNFNVVYRDDPDVHVVAFTQAQIPRLSDRRYPASLAGPRYPDGHPDRGRGRPGGDLPARARWIGVVFAYSDVPHAAVMHLASRALAAGADFALLGPGRTMLPARVPVIAISAIRTGCGKSQTARWLGRRLRERGRRVAVLRHPMPYGDLERAARAAVRAARPTSTPRAAPPRSARSTSRTWPPGTSCSRAWTTRRSSAQAEREADLIVWDGGNNDFPFAAAGPAHRHGRRAPARAGRRLPSRRGGAAHGGRGRRQQGGRGAGRQRAGGDRRGRARSIRGPRSCARPRRSGWTTPARCGAGGSWWSRTGPTLTHGGMAYGAGYVAATAGGAAAIVDPRASADAGRAGDLRPLPAHRPVLPAVGYDAGQLAGAARDDQSRRRGRRGGGDPARSGRADRAREAGGARALRVRRRRGAHAGVARRRVPGALRRRSSRPCDDVAPPGGSPPGRAPVGW